MTKNPYRGPAYWGKTAAYYIHYHQENIGAANNSKRVPNIINRFKNQKKQAYEESKNAYKSMFESNLSTKSEELLDNLFSDDNLMTEVNQQMSKALEAALDTNKLQNLMAQQRTVINEQEVFKKIAGRDTIQRVQGFSDLIDGLANACNLLESSEGAYIATQLLKTKSSITRKTTRATVGKKIQDAVKRFAIENEGATIDEKRIIHAANAINALANQLITGKTKKGEPITSSSIKRVIDDVFSLGFSEAVATYINNTAELAVDQALMRIVGKDTTKALSYTGGKFIETDSVARSGKVDIFAPNASFTIESLKNINGGTISIDLGISNKSYRTNDFGNLPKTGKNTFGVGSGGSFKSAIDLIFGNNVYNKYLAYNVMAHRTGMPAEAEALQDLLLTRQVMNLFASRGGSSDFAQFIIANGQVVSTWEILLQTEKFVGKSSSRNKEQPVSLSLMTKEAETAVKIWNQYERVSAVNKALSSMPIRAHLHIDKLKNAI